MIPATQAVDLTGRTIAERYDLLELIGTGGMGTVYRARDRELDEVVALKVIRNELARDPAMLARFRHEVKLARRVTHLNVARTFELGRADDIVFCTMELIVGESLTHRLGRMRRLPLADATAIACAMCDGLAAAHAAGVIHRDIKPDNVLIAHDGRVVLADFGVAAIATADGELSGTPAYMAPEQARGEPPSPAGDVYSVGIVLFEMLHGRRDVPAVELPPDLEAVLARATARERESRIASAAELRRDLAPWHASAPLLSDSLPGEQAASSEATVIVLAPRGDEARMYLADALHDRVLALLRRKPRLRVLARAQDEQADLVTTLTVGEAVDVRIRRHGAELELKLPLVFDHLESNAIAVVNAIVAAIAWPEPVPPGPAAEAHDLLLRARYNIWRDLSTSVRGYEQLVRAQELLPNDPQVAAVMALVLVRRAFFLANAPPDTLARAGAAAQRALAAAPDHPDSWLAAGHVELHHGNPVIAARRYRTAIARAPHHAEAHEYLGRMLLEAGHLDLALARLEAAVRIAPARRTVQWEIVRALALQHRWEDCDRLADELSEAGLQRPFMRARFFAWRGDMTRTRELMAPWRAQGAGFAPGLDEILNAAYFEGDWPRVRERGLALALTSGVNRRRTMFLAQLIAEMAGFSNDGEASADIISHAIAHGFFDLHWFDRCPLLDCVRALPRAAALRAPLQQRADAILDALYGEENLGTLDTAYAPSMVARPTLPSSS